MKERGSRKIRMQKERKGELRKWRENKGKEREKTETEEQ